MCIKIDAATVALGLFGHPVGHSLSPRFMNYAIKRLEINARYFAFDVAAVDLKNALEGIRALGFVGINITIPHKSAVIQHLDRVEEDADRIGAINCIYREGRLLIGANTDHSGFLRPLRERGISLKLQEAMLLGCGGAARAASYALFNEGVSGIHVVNRTKEHAIDFIEWCEGRFPGLACSYIGNSARVSRHTAEGCGIIVNTTPVGMLPGTGASPLPSRIEIGEHQVVYDLIYNPKETTLLQRARSSGATVINGLEMLISQGLFALTRWFPDRKEKILALERELLEYTERFL